MSNRPRMFSSGQSSVEFLVVCAALVFAMFTPIPSTGMNAAQTLAAMIREYFQAFSYFISLP